MDALAFVTVTVTVAGRRRGGGRRRRRWLPSHCITRTWMIQVRARLTPTVEDAHGKYYAVRHVAGRQCGPAVAVRPGGPGPRRLGQRSGSVPEMFNLLRKFQALKDGTPFYASSNQFQAKLNCE